MRNSGLCFIGINDVDPKRGGLAQSAYPWLINVQVGFARDNGGSES